MPSPTNHRQLLARHQSPPSLKPLLPLGDVSGTATRAAVGASQRDVGDDEQSLLPSRGDASLSRLVVWQLPVHCMLPPKQAVGRLLRHEDVHVLQTPCRFRAASALSEKTTTTGTTKHTKKEEAKKPRSAQTHKAVNTLPIPEWPRQLRV